MKVMQKASAAVIMAVLICALLATAALAAGSGSVWMNVVQQNGTAALILTDTTVTDGVIKLTYDSSALTYEGVTVTEKYVAMYAVNAQEEGTVQISWVAPEAYVLDGENACLITVNFTGEKEENSITLSGSAHDGDGNAVPVAGTPDSAALEAAVKEAKALDAQKYTDESFGAVEEALKAAEAVLADSMADQKQIDAAEKALREAMAGLKEISAIETTQATEATDSGSASPTRPAAGTGDNAHTGDTSHVVTALCVGLLAAAGIAVVLNKKGWCAE